MKKGIISIIPAILATTPVFADINIYDVNGLKVDLGGRVQMRQEISDGDSKDTSRARLNFAFEQKVNDDFSGIAYWNHEWKADGNTKQKDMYVGGKYKNHTAIYGQTDGAQLYVKDFTDMGPQYGSAGAYTLEISDADGKEKLRNFVFMSEYGKFDYKISYAPANELSADVDGSTFEGFSLAGRYQLPFGILFGAGFTDQVETKLTNNQEVDSKSWMFAVSRNFGNLYSAALVTTGEDNSNEYDDFIGYELAARYPITKKLSIMGQYQNLEVKHAGEDKTKTDQFVYGIKYNFASKYQGTITHRYDNIDIDPVSGEERSKNTIEFSLRIKL